MATHTDDPPAVALRVRDVVERTRLSRSQVYALIDQGLIPRLANCGAVVRIPAWCVDAWAATGDWQHPDWRPAPLHPDAS